MIVKDKGGKARTGIESFPAGDREGRKYFLNGNSFYTGNNQ